MAAAVRSIYNAMTSCLYPDVTAFTEEYRRWRIEVYDIETIFGKVTYAMRHGDSPKTIEANVVIPSRIQPQRVLLFVRSPFERSIKSVRINGADWCQWDGDREAVTVVVQRRSE
mgnify:CR=1 FL=1